MYYMFVNLGVTCIMCFPNPLYNPDNYKYIFIWHTTFMTNDREFTWYSEVCTCNCKPRSVHNETQWTWKFLAENSSETYYSNSLWFRKIWYFFNGHLKPESNKIWFALILCKKFVSKFTLNMHYVFFSLGLTLRKFWGSDC